MCVYTVLNKNTNAWIMHQDIPSQQSTALVSNITCHLQISPCRLFWGFVLRAKLLHHDKQTYPAVVCKNSALFQLGKNSSELSFPSPLCFLTCSLFLLTRRPAHGVKECAWSTCALTCFPLSPSEWGNPKRGVIKWWENKTCYFL